MGGGVGRHLLAEGAPDSLDLVSAYTIKIKTPADEVFELRVNGDMSVQMLKEAVLTHRHPNQTEGSSQSNMTVKLIAAGLLL